MLCVTTWMELAMIILNELKQIEKNIYHKNYLYAVSKKNDKNEIIHRTEIDPEIQKMNQMG